MSNHSPATSVDSSARAMSIIGIVLGVIALLFLPIILGPIGAILGFVANSKGDKPLGLYVGIGCIVATVVGMILGAIVFAANT
ncbi:hypothetical protein [Nocardioides plantarum]|uniref:DUF4190 domain-containing protein n=1 Tax=Nocardioides plantarum TaxID=29299 RepID=A0ABV5KFH8_9ACTN|nr:hypothetical protein [Nocardioides plantarum]